jgi:hypothetical protein
MSEIWLRKTLDNNHRAVFLPATLFLGSHPHDASRFLNFFPFLPFFLHEAEVEKESTVSILNIYVVFAKVIGQEDSVGFLYPIEG